MYNKKLVPLWVIAIFLAITPVFAGNSGNTGLAVNVLETISITVSGSGAFTGEASGNWLSPSVITITSLSSVPIDVDAVATDLNAGGGRTILAENIQIVNTLGDYQSFSSNQGMVDIARELGNTPINKNLRLKIPLFTPPANYVGTITYTASKHPP